MAQFHWKIFKKDFEHDACRLIEISGKFAPEHLKIPALLDGIPIVDIDPKFFKGMLGTKKITIPKTIESLGKNRDFASFLPMSLEYIEVDTANKVFTSIDGVLYKKDTMELLFYPPSRKNEIFYVPLQAKKLGKVCFNMNGYLKKVVIGCSIKQVPTGIFKGCFRLEEIEILSSDFVMDSNRFAGCSNLRNIIVSGKSDYLTRDGVLFKSIKKKGVKLLSYPAGRINQSYKVPEDTIEIEKDAFLGCSKLSFLSIPEGCLFKGDVRGGINLNRYKCSRTVEVPKKEKHENHLPDIVAPVYKPTKMGPPITKDDGLSYVLGKTTCTITYIDPKRYLNSKGVLDIPAHIIRNDRKFVVKELGRHVFQDFDSCGSKVRAIKLPDELQSFDLSLLKPFNNLENILCTKVGQYKKECDYLVDKKKSMIVYCPPLSKIKYRLINQEIKNIGPSAFAGCVNLGRISFEGHVHIYGKAFAKCKHLHAITFRQSVRCESEIFNGVQENLNIVFAGTCNKEIESAFYGSHNKFTIYYNDYSVAKALSRFISDERFSFTHLLKSEIVAKIRELKQEQVEEDVQPSQPTLSFEDKAADYIPMNSIVVVAHKFACLVNGHHLQTRYVKIRLLDDQKNLRDVVLEVGYCVECRKYYVYTITFNNLIYSYYEKGWQVIGTEFHLPDNKVIGKLFTATGDLRAKSILKECGYSVDQKSSMSHSERVSILRNIISSGMMTREEVKNYLNWFCEYIGKGPGMENAVARWKADYKDL